MSVSYEEIEQFFKTYFEAFNAYGQNPNTIHRMDEYFTPDFEFRPYVSHIAPVKGRDAWYQVLLSHPSGYEKLTPEIVLIDERRMAAAIKIKAEIIDSQTQEVLVTKRYFGYYPLVLDSDQTLKIPKLEFFWETLPPGTMEVDDVFERDWKK
jgi:hypothetical protein